MIVGRGTTATAAVASIFVSDCVWTGPSLSAPFVASSASITFDASVVAATGELGKRKATAHSRLDP